MEVTTFAGALVTNVAEHAPRQRQSYASYCRDCRSDKQGWLVRRKGMTRISDLSGFTEVFLHKTVLLVVVNGILKWARIRETADQLTFNDFVEGGYRLKEGSERVAFRKLDDCVYISTGKASFVVEVPDLPNVPSVQAFYLRETPVFDVTALTETKPENTKLIDLKFQAIYVRDEQETLPTMQGVDPASTTGKIDIPTLANRAILAPVSDPVVVEVSSGEEDVETPHPINEFFRDIYASPSPAEDETTIYFEVVRQGPLRIDVLDATERIIRTLHDSLVEVAPPGTPTPDSEFEKGSQEIEWNGHLTSGDNAARGIYIIRFRYVSGLEPTDKSENDYKFTIGITRSPVDTEQTDDFRTLVEITIDAAPADHANYIDVYASRRDNRESFYWIARIPYVEDTVLSYRFPRTDPAVGDALIDAGDTVNFQYISTNDFRTYAAKANDNRVYLSYYDPGEEIKLHQNFVDFITLDLQGGSITGIHFIRDNLLIVYATNQIQIIGTDPISELHQVVDFISPQDDVGNTIGCIAPDSIVDMGGEHFFLAANRYVYRFNSRSVRSFSDAVQAIFDSMALPITESGEPELSRAISFSYQKDYFISIPSQLESEVSEYPNTTLMYDVEYRRWWQDSYAVRGVSKGYPERLYTVIGDRLFELFDGDTDDGTKIRRVWHSNPELRRTHDKFRSVHVYAMGPATIDVTAKTEQSEESGKIIVEQTSDVWSQRLGVNLRGRNFIVEIATESDAPIDRILTNELFRS